ncbi:MAG: rRNA pseudouridine synthase [Vicinamibacteria bacterium]|nr:rRNA pseudouridine synthase [Vicinamibacteria bacterium]
MSRLRVCSRREAARWIRDARVTVEHRIVVDPATRVHPAYDRIAIDGVPVAAPRDRVVIALHKPAGVVTTRVDARNRPTVYDLLSGLETWVFPVGRLDRDSSGLLILTNDHRLGVNLADPDQGVPKVYHVRVRDVPSQGALRCLQKGMTLQDGTMTRPATVRNLGVARDGQSWIEFVLHEGKNRQIRRMCAMVGHDVLALTRVSVAGLSLGFLAQGAWRRLTRDEIRRLMRGSRQRRDHVSQGERP